MGEIIHREGVEPRHELLHRLAVVGVLRDQARALREGPKGARRWVFPYIEGSCAGGCCPRMGNPRRKRRKGEGGRATCNFDVFPCLVRKGERQRGGVLLGKAAHCDSAIVSTSMLLST